MHRFPMRTIAPLALTTALISPAVGQTCSLMADINPTSSAVGSSPQKANRGREFVRLGSRWIFTAFRGDIGRELWSTDGTQPGTSLLKDIRPNGSSFVADLTPCGSRVFFVANDGTHGKELWITDGTTQGTQLVRDIRPGSANGSIFNPVCMGGKLYFAADDGTTGSELWVSDGTTAGTQLVHDFPSSLGPRELMVNSQGTAIYFRGIGAGVGTELWQSDGTAAGTVLVRDIRPGGLSSDPEQFVNFGNITLFVATGSPFGNGGDEVWRTDGTSAGTVRVADIRPGAEGSFPRLFPLNASVLGGKYYFTANDGTRGSELWSTDGTAAGTSLAADIAPGSLSSSPSSPTSVGSTLYFTAFSTTGRELWKFDGTTASLVRDIRSGSSSSDPGFLTESAGRLVFFANDGANGREPWISDGTSSGTRIVRDIQPGSASGIGTGANTLTAVGNRTLFVANDGRTGSEIWTTDGTAAGTSLLINIGPDGNAGSSPRVLHCAFGSTLIVQANNGSGTGGEPWAVDQNGNATLLGDISPGLRSSTLGAFASTWTGSRAITVFSADDRTHGSEPWVTDGTRGGTKMLRDIFTGSRGSGPEDLTACNGAIYFTARTTAEGRELWKTDGTTAGTVLVKDINPGSLGSDPSSLTCFRGKLYFDAFFPGTRSHLGVSDGTPGGTTVIPTGGRQIRNLTAINDRLWMSMDSGDIGSELWTSDGTSTGTQMVAELRPGVLGSDPDGFTKVGDFVYFAATGPAFRELYRSNGTAAGTTLVRDINPSGSGSPEQLTACGSRLFFVADDGTTGPEVWVSDGTAAGTRLVADINPGRLPPPGVLICAGSHVLFRMVQSPVGSAWYRTDGTTAGTSVVCNPSQVRPNSGGIVCGGRVVFVGTSAAHGRELFAISPDGGFVAPLGSGCGPTHPILDAATPPLLGQTVTLNNRRGPNNHIGVALLGSPMTRPVTLPLSNRCTQWLDLSLFVVAGQAPANAASWQASFAVPNDPTLVGGTVVGQSIYLQQSTVFPLSASNGLALTIGR